MATVAAADRLGAAVVLGEGPAVTRGDDASPLGLCAVRARVGADARGRPAVTPAGRRPDPSRGTDGDALLPRDASAIFWTSGSTGAPKAVLLGRPALEYQAEASWERFRGERADHWLVPLPLAHAYGFGIVRMWLRHRPTLHVVSGIRAGAVAGHLMDPRATLLDGVPSLYGILARLAERAPRLARRLAALKLRGCGGDVLPASTARRFADVVGAPIHDGYGLSEAGPNVAVSGPDVHRSGTVGTALRGTELRIDPRDGEILVRGPGLMTGYLGDEKATAEAVTADGWLRTGDRGELSADGYLRVTGRLKDAIVVQGETFAPSEVEAAFEAIREVTDVAVVGVPHAGPRGDLVVAFVATDDRVDRAALRGRLHTALRSSLPPALRPRHIEFTAALPKLPSGKTDRAALRRRLRERHG